MQFATLAALVVPLFVFPMGRRSYSLLVCCGLKISHYSIGSMLLLGKHQFIVSEVTTNDGLSTSYASDPKTSSEKTRWFAKLMETTPDEKSGTQLIPSSQKDSYSNLNDLVGNADELLKALSAINTEDDRILIEEKVRRIRDAAAEAARIGSLNSDPKIENLKIDDNSQKKKSEKKSAKNSMTSDYPSDDESDPDRYDRESGVRCRLVLTCFAPEGSPLLGIVLFIPSDKCQENLLKLITLVQRLVERPPTLLPW